MISGPFIARPRLAAAVSIVIALAGAIALFFLPVTQYPNIAPPAVSVTALYPGADAEVIADTVGAPIEAAVNGVEGMLYMSSTSSSAGRYTLTVTFAVGTDPDIAQVNVQNRAQLATARLPPAVAAQGLTIRTRAPDFLLTAAFFATEGSGVDPLAVSNLANTVVADALSRVPGVGEAATIGTAEYAMRLWLDARRMAALGVTPDDVAAAVARQNVQASLGQAGGAPAPEGQQEELTILARGRLPDAAAFGDIIVRTGPDGAVLRLGDIGRAELGAQSYQSRAVFRDQPAIVLRVSQSPGSNALEAADAVRAELERLSEDFPEGVEYAVVYDATRFVRATVRQILVTLGMTFAVVVAVTFVFLRSWRATLVPALAIPVSLLGALAVLLAVGFSANTISLLALILAVGLVVDDAILVVENVERVMEEDPQATPAAAAVTTMRQVSGPIVATTLVLLAVFAPTAFLPGINGQLYRQFAVTISAALVISSLVALTLSPALAATLLRRHEGPPRRGPLAWFAAGIARTREGYGRLVARLVARAWLAVVVSAVALAAAGWLFLRLPATLVPAEDQGAVFVDVRLPDAASLQRTQAVMDEVRGILEATPGVERVVSSAGYSILQGARLPNGGLAIAALRPWDERDTEETALPAILGALRAHFAGIPGAVIGVFPPPAIPGVGSVGGLDLRLQARRGQPPEELAEVARALVGAANAEEAIGGGASITFTADVPRLELVLDRTRAEAFGVGVGEVFSTLGALFGSRYVNDFTLEGRVYRVILQAEASQRARPEDAGAVHIRNAAGEMVPLRALASLETVLGPYTLTRYNLFTAAQVNAQPASGRSTGEAIAALEAAVAETLPEGYGVEWTGTAFQQRETAAQTPYILAIALVFAYLFLLGQYESWMLPVPILLSLAIASLGAVAALTLRGMENSLYTQIGLVLLIALASKNAILVVEFARSRRAEGATVAQAAETAARQRFRAVLMTALSFVVGVLPLALATGAGAGARQAIGTTVLGGMLAAATIGLLLIPALYAALQRLAEGRWRGGGDNA